MGDGTEGEQKQEKQQTVPRLFESSQRDPIVEQAEKRPVGATSEVVNNTFSPVSQSVRTSTANKDPPNNLFEKYRLIALSTSDLIAFTTFDQNALYTFVSPSHKKILGFDAEDLLGKSGLDIIHDDDKKFLITLLRKYIDVKANGLLTEDMMKNTPRLEYRIHDKSGQWHYFQSTVDIVNNELLLVSKDLTQQKKIEAKLQENEKRLSAIIQGLSIAAFFLNKNHEVVYWNKALEELSKIPAKDVIGTTYQWKAFYSGERPVLADILIDGDIEKVKKWYTGKFEKSTLLDESYEATDFFPNLGTSGKWLRFAATSIRDTNGEMIGVLEILEDVSERKKAEIAVKESEKKYRLVVENAMEMIIVAQDGLLKFANHSTYEVFGYTPEEMLNKSYIEFVYPDDRQLVLENHSARLKGEHTLPFYSFRIVTKQGKIRWVDIEPIVISWEGKHATLNFLRDVTDHRKTIEELATSERKYQKLYNNLRDGSAAVDLQGKITECNTAFESLTGYSFNELRNMTFSDLTPAKWHSLEKRILDEQVLKLGYSDLYEKEYLRKDGKTVPIELQTYALYDAQRQLSGFWAFVRDVSTRKKMESEQKQNEERIRAIVMNAPIGIAVMDATKNFISANSAFCNILDYTEDTLKKMNFIDIVPSEDFNVSMKRMADLENGGISFFQLETRFIKKDGKQITGKIMVNALRNQNGAPYLFISELEDVTERKQIYDELKKSEDKFVKAFKASPIAVSISRLNDGKFIEANEAFEKFFGYSKEELFSETAIQKGLWFDNKDRDLVVHELHRTGSVREKELLFRTKGDVIKIARCSAELIQINKEECFLAVLIDLTEQKKAEELLRESEEKYRCIVENTKDVILLVRPDGKISYVSPASAEVFGYIPIELVGTTLEIFHPDDMEKARLTLATALQGKSENNVELRAITKMKETKWISNSWYPINHENNIKYIVGVLRDVTEEKKAEQNLREKIAELERYKSITVNRELKMVELKSEVQELRKKTKEDPR
jgi:PAS domain S-box-containing protein